MAKTRTMLDSFAQWWFGDDFNPKRKKRRKKRGKANK